MTNKITVVMPTYNRSECVAYYLENAVAKYNGDFFVFEIHDSSTNDETKDLVNRYNASECTSKIRYFRYPSSVNGDDKVFCALKRAETDYAYLIGDGVLPDFEKLELFLKNNEFSKFDVIGIFPPCYRYKSNKKKHPKNDCFYEEANYDDLLVDYLPCFTLYGASIVQKDVITWILEHDVNSKFCLKETNSGAYCLYGYQMSLFETIKSCNLKVGLSFLSFWGWNPKKKGNWVHDESFYKIFYVEFINDVEKLSYPEELKEQALKNIARFHFTYGSILRYRLKNVFTVKLLKKYKPYVKKINNHYWFMWFVAFIPKWVIYIFYWPLRYTKRGMKKLLKKD